MTTRPLVVIDTPPTPNGDLHIGHLAGPFLNADVHARFARARGRDVYFSSGTDDSQTYVYASARRRGIEAADLARNSARSAERTLAEMAVSIDGFATYDDGYRARVLDFVGRLHAAGVFERRTVPLPYSEKNGEFLVEGLVTGECPVCLVDSRGGLCETCGHPNNFAELLHPRSTVDGYILTHRSAEILVLPLERYRERLVAYYAERRDALRPHTVHLIDELLSRPLPDFPITYPIAWGIPAPFPETPGQRINAWVEGMPAAMYTTSVAADATGRGTAETDDLWRAEHDAEVVYFIGFDNVYFWGITHIALLMAHEGRYVLPACYLTNEFYELENAKFSTSLGHVLHSRDLLREVPRDLIRFYLGVTCPEHQRTNFSRAALDEICTSRLVEPWNQLSAATSKIVAELGADDDRAMLPTSAEGRRDARTMVMRLSGCYEIDAFSLSRATELLIAYVDRLRRIATSLAEPTLDRSVGLAALAGDLLLQTRAVAAAAGPLLTDLAEAVVEAAGCAADLRPESYEVAEVAAFVPPPMPGIMPAD